MVVYAPQVKFLYSSFQQLNQEFMSISNIDWEFGSAILSEWYLLLQKIFMFSILTKDASGSPMMLCGSASWVHVSLKLIMWHAILVHFSKFGLTQWPKTCGTYIPNLNIISLVLRGKNELESDFRRLWEEFRSSSSEKVPWHLFYFFHRKSIVRPCELVLALTLYSVFSLCRRKKGP